jgi:hypothetical protein
VEITDGNPQFTPIARRPERSILALFALPHQGAVMSRERQEQLVDVAQLTLGGAFFAIVATLTGAGMAVGYVVLTAADRLRPR